MMVHLPAGISLANRSSSFYLGSEGRVTVDQAMAAVRAYLIQSPHCAGQELALLIHSYDAMRTRSPMTLGGLLRACSIELAQGHIVAFSTSAVRKHTQGAGRGIGGSAAASAPTGAHAPAQASAASSASGWSSPATAPAPATSSGALVDPQPDVRAIVISDVIIAKKFKHASDFGITGTYGKANAEAYKKALISHATNDQTTIISGTYRGKPANHLYNPRTGLNIIVDKNSNVVSAWKLSPAQTHYITTTGNLGGGP